MFSKSYVLKSQCQYFAIFSLFHVFFFFRAVLDLQHWEGVTEISHIPLPSQMHSLLTIDITHHNAIFFTKDKPTLTHHDPPNSLSVAHSMGLDKCVITYTLSYKGIT